MHYIKLKIQYTFNNDKEKESDLLLISTGGQIYYNSSRVSIFVPGLTDMINLYIFSTTVLELQSRYFNVFNTK